MFNLEKALMEWRQQMIAAGVKSPETLNELEIHLRDDVEQPIRSGLNAQQAFNFAVQRMGQIETLNSEFRKLGGTKWRLLRRIKSKVFGRRETRFPSLSKFNSNALQTLEFARREPPLFGHDFIGTEHVLLGILKLENGLVSKVLRRLGVDREMIKLEIAEVVGSSARPIATAPIPFTPRARKALDLAAGEAKKLKQSEIGPEHIFLGLLREGSGVAALVLKKLGMEVERTRAEIIKESGSQ
ncbi:MAG: clpA [Verrucomicrobiales bacterium]|nr:clpA [Verrucomicrobiales bacterium]